MYKVYGLGYTGSQHVPLPIDYIVWATGYEDAIRKVCQLGIVVIQCTVEAIG
jgi:hypothetical protein